MDINIQIEKEGNAYNRDLIIMTLPLLLLSFVYYGPRCLLLAILAVVLARLCDRVVAWLRARPYNAAECSSVAFALLIVLMMPANVPIHMLVAAVLMAILVAKEAFGGFGSYPFHPAAVGFCMAAVCWPETVLRYPQSGVWFMNTPDTFTELLKLWNFTGVALVDGPSYSLKLGGLPSIDLWNLFVGNYAGALGITSTLVIVACAVFLLVRRRVSPITPLCFLGTAFLLVFFFPRVDIAPRAGEWALLLQLRAAGYELFSGAMTFAAFFLACDPGVQPRRTLSRVLYGILLGVGTVLFRYFGTYELGACFALLLVNALSGFIDRPGKQENQAVKEVARP